MSQGCEFWYKSAQEQHQRLFPCYRLHIWRDFAIWRRWLIDGVGNDGEPGEAPTEISKLIPLNYGRRSSGLSSPARGGWERAQSQ
jgi:hypothetical protein